MLPFRLLLVAVALVGCGLDIERSAPTTTSVGTESSGEVTIIGDVATGGSDELDPAVATMTPTGPTRTYVFPALGGIRLEALADHDVYSAGDRVIVDPVGGLFAFDAGAAYVGLTTSGRDGTRVRTVDEFLSRLSGIDARPTGTFVDLFGYRMQGFETIKRDGGADPEVFLVNRFGAEGRLNWTPERDVVFLADTAAGVLYVGYDTGGVPDDPVGRSAFSLLVESAELTGPGLDMPLPDGVTPRAGGSQPAPAPVADGDVSPLQFAFDQVNPGRYQLPNFGQALSVELSGWWVRPNQPGIVALSRRNSVGAGDSAVVFVGGLEPHIVPQTGGPSRFGEPVDLSDIRAFLAEPPSNLEVSNIIETDVAGESAIRFDARIADGQSCAQDDPCEYAFETTWPWNFPVAVQAELAHRIWWFPEHPTGVGMIHASDLDPAFLDLATELVESAEPVGS